MSNSGRGVLRDQWRRSSLVTFFIDHPWDIHGDHLDVTRTVQKSSMEPWSPWDFLDVHSVPGHGVHVQNVVLTGGQLRDVLRDAGELLGVVHGAEELRDGFVHTVHVQSAQKDIKFKQHNLRKQRSRDYVGLEVQSTPLIVAALGPVETATLSACYTSFWIDKEFKNCYLAYCTVFFSPLISWLCCVNLTSYNFVSKIRW